MPSFTATGQEEWVCQRGGHICTGESTWVDGEGNVCPACFVETKDAGDDSEPLQFYQSIVTHNGLFTIKSIRTGDHRTFRVRTQPDNAQFAPGKRVVSLLTGANNETDYQGFAFVDEFGIKVWRKHLGTQYEELARMLENLHRHVADGKVEVHVSCRCRVCNRTLTTPESVQSGIGPICAGRN
jgi:hypothetical protein